MEEKSFRGRDEEFMWRVGHDLCIVQSCHAKPPRNIHATREVTLSARNETNFSKNNLIQITFGKGHVWGYPLSSLYFLLGATFVSLNFGRL